MAEEAKLPKETVVVELHANTEVELAILECNQLFTQKLPIERIIYTENQTTYATKSLYYNDVPQHKVHFKTDFTEFGESLLQSMELKNTGFPRSGIPSLRYEDSAKEAFKANVLEALQDAFKKDFLIESAWLIGRFKADYALLRSSGNFEGKDCKGMDFLLIEAKRWYAFMDTKPYKKMKTEALEESVNLTSGEVLNEDFFEKQEEESFEVWRERVGFKSTWTPKGTQQQMVAEAKNHRKPGETDGQYQFRIAMKQLRAYLFEMKREVAYGILTSYCHTYFVILDRQTVINELKISPIVNYSEAGVLKKIAEFIQLARTTTIKGKELTGTISREGGGDIPDGGNNGNGGKTTEDEQGHTRKRIKVNENNNYGQTDVEGSSKRGQEVSDDQYVIGDVIGWGRSGCVLRIVDRAGHSLAAKVVGERRCKDDTTEEDIINELRNEKMIYEKLKDLQGKVVPQFHFSGFLMGSYTLVMDELLADPISEYNLSDAQKKAIVVALDMIHERGILHGDIRSSNILIDELNPKQVYFIDFAMAVECNSEHDYRFRREMNELRALLNMDLLP